MHIRSQPTLHCQRSARNEIQRGIKRVNSWRNLRCDSRWGGVEGSPHAKRIPRVARVNFSRDEFRARRLFRVFFSHDYQLPGSRQEQTRAFHYTFGQSDSFSIHARLLPGGASRIAVKSRDARGLNRRVVVLAYHEAGLRFDAFRKNLLRGTKRPIQHTSTDLLKVRSLSRLFFAIKTILVGAEDLVKISQVENTDCFDFNFKTVTMAIT